MSTFGQHLRDPQSGYTADFDIDSRTLMIVLAGMKGEVGIPSFPRAPTSRDSRLHYSSADRLDALHARRMGGVPGYRVYGLTAGGHQLVRVLRDRGELSALLREVPHPS